MKNKFVWLGATAVTVGVLAGGAGVAAAETGVLSSVTGSDDQQLTGEVLDKAVAAAMAVVGEGKVTDSEADEGGYEVEILKTDGEQIEVNLDSLFKVVGSEVDDDSSDGTGD